MKQGKSAVKNRLGALIYKESLQIVRDPSAIFVAFVLPVILLLLFAFAVSLDVRKVPVGVVLSSDTPTAQSLAAAFSGSRYFTVLPMRHTQEAKAAIIASKIRGYIVIPADVETRLHSRTDDALIQVIADGSQPNTANFVTAYAQGIASLWQAQHGYVSVAPVSVQPRFWFNAELESRRSLIPGSIAIIMTMIGTLLTALVVAREWERGTMEGLLSTPATITEILLGKLLPYFVLGMLATLGSALMAVFAFDVPLRGSWLVLMMLAAVFLIPALGQGLVISILAKNQFIAAQLAAFTGFLPAFMLSGFLFEIDSMPWPIRLITHIIPTRYFVEALQTVFLVGNVWSLLLTDMLAMLLIGALLFVLARAKCHKSLEE